MNSPIKGKIWVHNVNGEKCVFPHELVASLLTGWQKGRCLKVIGSNCKNTKWIYIEENNKIIKKRIPVSEIEHYLKEGWKLGQNGQKENCGLCHKQKSYDFFILNLKEKRPNLILLNTKENYKSKKVIVKCIHCNKIFHSNIWSILSAEKYQCCTIEQTSIRFGDSEKEKHNLFLKRLNKITSTILVLEQYKKSSIPLLCECTVCKHNWYVKPNGLLSDTGCPICRGGVKYNLAQFSQLVKKSSPEWELLDIEYTTHTLSTVKCKTCGNIRKTGKQKLVLGQINCHFCKPKRQSNPERKIEKYLIDKKINYVFQQRYSDLKGKNKQPLRFDFYLPEYNLCIEYDGEGHFKKDFYLNKTGFIDYTNDIKKDKYCNENNIKLLRIPYWEKKNMIEYLDLYLSGLKNFTSVITNNYRGKEYIHLAA